MFYLDASKPELVMAYFVEYIFIPTLHFRLRRDLSSMVNRIANLLLRNGVTKGAVVSIYMCGDHSCLILFPKSLLEIRIFCGSLSLITPSLNVRPVSPLAVASMLACVRIGALHNVVFAGFSAEALAGR